MYILMGAKARANEGAFVLHTFDMQRFQDAMVYTHTLIWLRASLKVAH